MQGDSWNFRELAMGDKKVIFHFLFWNWSECLWIVIEEENVAFGIGYDKITYWLPWSIKSCK